MTLSSIDISTEYIGEIVESSTRLRNLLLKAES